MKEQSTGQIHSVRIERSFRIAAGAIIGAFGATMFGGDVLAGPDLEITDVDVSGVLTDSQSLEATGSIQVRIENIGDTDVTDSFRVTAFEDHNGDGLLDGGDLVLGDTVVGAGVPAGGDSVVPVSISGTVLFAGNIVYAFADSDGEIAEDDEGNNIRHSGESCFFVPPVGPFSPTLEWSWTSSLTQPSALNVMMTPSVIDITQDGVPDVVFGATASTGGGLVEVGYLRALNGDDGSEIFTLDATTPVDLRINTTTSIATGDIDLDGLPEIIACDVSGVRLIAFEHDGSFKWRSGNLEALYWGAPSIADLNQDGTPEIIVGRQALDNLGNVLWTGTGGRGNQGSTGPLSAVADIDLDGLPEVIGGNTVYSNTGAIEANLQGVGDGYPAIANFDADPEAEIVLVSNGRVYLFDHTGVLKASALIPGGGAGGPPTIADYDSDGEPEVGVAGASRYAVFETDLSLKWASVTQDGSSNRTGSSVFDFEGDGSAEVVYRDELKLRIYDGNDGTILFETPLSSCTWHEYVLVADVDADGNAEIVAVANNNCGFGPQRGIFVFGDADDNWVPTRRIWNQHTYHITNVNADGTIPAVEENNWLAGLNNYRLNEFLPGEGDSFDAPDLVTSAIGFDESNCPASLVITARVGNGGSLLTAAGVNVSFYDGDPASGSTSLLGVVPTSAPLEPGEFEVVSLVLASPAVGDLTVFVVADDDGTGVGSVNECNEDNNSAHVTERICDPDCIENLVARAKRGKVQLTWTHVPGSTYDVLRSQAAAGPFTTIATTNSTWSLYLDTSVTSGQTYFYKIRRTPGIAGDAECVSDSVEVTVPTGRTRR